MRGKLARKVRKLMPSIDPGYTKLSNGQLISQKRMAYQKAKRAAK